MPYNFTIDCTSSLVSRASGGGAFFLAPKLKLNTEKTSLTNSDINREKIVPKSLKLVQMIVFSSIGSLTFCR